MLESNRLARLRGADRRVEHGAECAIAAAREFHDTQQRAQRHVVPFTPECHGIVTHRSQREPFDCEKAFMALFDLVVGLRTAEMDEFREVFTLSAGQCEQVCEEWDILDPQMHAALEHLDDISRVDFHPCRHEPVREVRSLALGMLVRLAQIATVVEILEYAWTTHGHPRVNMSII